MTDGEMQTLVTTFAESINTMQKTINSMGERVDRALEQHSAYAVDIQGLRIRVENIEKRRQVNLLIPLMAASLTISLGTLGLTIAVLFQVLAHISTSGHP